MTIELSPYSTPLYPLRSDTYLISILFLLRRFVSISTVDVGLPQLAMHSAVETAGAYDLADMISVLTRLYSSNIDAKGDKIVIK